MNPVDSGARAQVLEYLRVLLHRRAVVLGSLGVVVATVMLATLFTVPEYQATTTVQIDRQNPEILTFKDVMGIDPSYSAYQDFYQTQYKILQSKSVLRLAADRLDLPNLPEFAGRRPSPLSRLVAWAFSLLPDSGSPTEGKEDPLDAAVGFLAAGLEVRPVRNSQLVQIAFTDRSPDLARRIADAVAEAYLEFTYQARYGTTTMAREFLTKEVLRVQGEIGALEERLQAYGAEKEILSMDSGTQDISQQALAAINANYIEARGRLAVAEARFRAVRTADPGSLPEVLESPLIAKLKEQYAEIERKHSQMSERFRPGWPALGQLEQEMRQARERLDLETSAIARQVREAAETDYRRARAEVENLAEQVDRQKKEVQRVNLDAIQYASLKAEIETKRKVLTDLVSRQNETATSERLKDTGTSNIRIVDAAEIPKTPVRPRKMLNLLLALVLGTGLGVAAAFFLDWLDNTVKDENDIARVSGLSVLGHVPRYQALRVVEGPADAPPTAADIDLASHADPRSAFAEAFKNLRTSLLLASPEHPPRHVVVTSCEPQDGKSTVSTNLAITLAQAGKKVLLVDADLRRPRLHRSFGASNEVGLSSLLSGNASVDEVIQELEIPGLSLVASGPVPPNPSELLGSPALRTFLAGIDDGPAFDVVVLDSPPVGSVTDPVLLSASLDVTVVVVRAGKTTREFLVHTAARLRQAHVKVAGTVLNDVTDKTGGYYYGRYRYYRHYHAGLDETVPGAKRRFLKRYGRRAGSA